MVSNNNKKNNQKDEHVRAFVTEALPDTLFRITVEETGEQKIAYLAGKMRLYRIKVLVGDTVEVKLDEYGGKARIHKRL